VLEKFGLDPKTMPLKPMSVEQCVSEGLGGLLNSSSMIVPGRLNRIMNALVPASLARKIEADMLGKRACQQVRSCKRTGGGLINRLRMGRAGSLVQNARPHSGESGRSNTHRRSTAAGGNSGSNHDYC
jgi:hypothetical protein